MHPSGNAGRCAYFLAFQLGFSVSPSFLCSVNFIVGRCFDMLMCRENLPAVAQGEAMPKPGRLIRMFLRVHIILLSQPANAILLSAVYMPPAR